MYAPGTFLMYIDMDAEYPAFAPKARFITPILHPNVTKQGRICHSILDRISLQKDPADLQVTGQQTLPP